MIVIGEYNTLKAIRQTDNGIYLGDESGDSVLLPNRYIPESFEIGDTLEVFVYGDNDNRPTATTLRPKVTLNQFGVLKVKKVSDYGAFMDWGLAKDLLVPFREQQFRLEEGNSVVIYLYMDAQSERLVGSSKISDHLMTELVTVKVGDEVDLMVFEISELGLSVIINGVHKGLVFHDEIYTEIQIGEERKGYIKNIRPDNKIDVSLNPFGYRKVEPNAQFVLSRIEINNGFIELTDNSDPKLIYEEFKMSKKLFKKAIGSLYKQRLIRIEENGIYLTNMKSK